MWNRIVLLLIFLTPVLVGGAPGTEAAGDAPAGQAEVSCPIDRGPVTTNILLRVFPVRIGARGGTAFTVEIEDRQYIVTAKHVLEGELPATVEVELDDWTRIPVTLVGRGRGQQDVLVLATDRQVSAAFPVDVGMGGLMLGQSVRFLGYFPRVRTSPLPGYKKRGAPLVMSGIVSGFHFDETGADGPSLWIDGHNNKGFSGDLHFSEFLRGDAHEHRQDPVRSAHGLPAMDYFHADRRPVWRRSPGPDAFLRRAIPVHGLRPADLPGKPARHRDLPLGPRIETLSHGLPPAGPALPVPTKGATGVFQPAQAATREE